MALTWTRAATVTAGERITSLQMRSLARAVNDRLKSGVADGAWRVAMWWFNLIRQPRWPSDGGTVFPPQGEFWEIYQHLDPENGTGQWPLTPPGDYEGANVAGPMMQFVYGNGVTLGQEDDRINDPNVPLWIGASAPTSYADIWELGKRQRGVYAPASGDQNVPALTAAQSWFAVTTDKYSPHGKAWGGYFPTPTALLDDCGPTDETGKFIPSLEIKFTGLRADADTSEFHGTVTTNGSGMPVVTYDGSCPSWTEYKAPGHVQFILRMPFAYYVGVWNGSTTDIDVFQLEDWIEGRYTGQGVLTREDGGHLSRALWTFISEFRGRPEDRGGNPNIRQLAFDFQSFFTRQYFLAPARGVNSGAGIESIYPGLTVTSNTAAGYLPILGGSTSHAIASGFVIAGMVAHASGLSSAATISLLVDDEAVYSVTLTPDDAGDAEAIQYFAVAKSGSTLRIRADTSIAFSGAGSLTVECAELLEMKPDFWDAYLLLRMSATAGGDQFGAGVDGNGRDCWFAKELFDRYQRHGCILNQSAAGVRTIAEWVSDNPVYDSMRRLSRDCVRIVPRRQLLSYTISGGKSVLKFKRWAYGLYNDEADMFRGIAPSYEPMVSGELEIGRDYLVRGTGSVEHNHQTIATGATFTATVATFTAQGVAQVFEADGIVTTAPQQGWTNEWLMFMQTHVYHWSPSSQWTSDAYADYYTWCNRCLFYTGYPGSKAFNSHVNYNYRVTIDARPDGTGWDLGLASQRVQGEYLTPEAPTGYTYAEAANRSPYSTSEFYLTCPVYQQPYQLESVTSDGNGAAEIVTMVFTDRFSAVSGADDTFGEQPWNWTGTQVTYLTDETYRTDDNALRDYLLQRSVGDFQCPFRTGDAGTGSSVTGLADNPAGSCYPHFIFVHQIPEPYNDGNVNQERHDSLARIDELRMAEIYIRAMCEGYIDGETSAEITCETGNGSMYDYRFETLCNSAFGGRWIGAFSLEDRADSPSGHGPLANTKMYAEVFNRLSACVNLLYRARVMVPFDVECNVDSYSGTKTVSQDWGDDCTASGVIQARWEGTPPAATTLYSAGGWTGCTSIPLARVVSSITGCDGTGYSIQTLRDVATIRVVVTPAYEAALNADLLDAIQNSSGMMMKLTTITTRPTATQVGTIGEADACGAVAHAFWDGAVGWTFDEVVTISEVCVATTGNETFDPGPIPPPGVFYFCRDTTPNELANASSIDIHAEILTDAGFYVEATLVDLTGD